MLLEQDTDADAVSAATKQWSQAKRFQDGVEPSAKQQRATINKFALHSQRKIHTQIRSKTQVNSMRPLRISKRNFQHCLPGLGLASYPASGGRALLEVSPHRNFICWQSSHRTRKHAMRNLIFGDTWCIDQHDRWLRTADRRLLNSCRTQIL